MSSKLRTLERRNMVLVGLIVLFTLVLFLRPDATQAIRESNYPLLFPKFKKEDARRITLSRVEVTGKTTGRVELATRETGEWVVVTSAGYPVRPGVQERLLDGIASVRSKGTVTIRKETFDGYAGPTGWTEVEVFGASNAPMARFAIGKYADYPELFVRMGEGDDAKIVKSYKLTADMASPEASAWIDQNLWAGLLTENVIRIDVKQRDHKRTISIAKRGESPADVELDVPEKDAENPDKIYWMVAPEEGDTKTPVVEDLIRTFTGARIKDVISGSTTSQDDETYGFKDPETEVTVWYKVGDKVERYGLTVGRRAKDDEKAYYMRRSGSTHVFTGHSYALGTFSKAPDEFLDKPDEPEDAGGSPDGDAAGDPDGGAMGDPDGGAAGDPDGDGDKPPAPADPAKPDDDPKPPEEDPKKPDDEPKKPDEPKDPEPKKPDEPKGPGGGE